MSSVEFQPRAQIFINPACIVKFYGAVITPEFTSSKDMWKITSGKEIYSTFQFTMDFDSYYSSVNFYGNEINLKSAYIRYGSSGLSTIGINSYNINYMIFTDCGNALIIEDGNIFITNIIIHNCSNIGILCMIGSDINMNNHIIKCIIINILKKGISIENKGELNINKCYFYNDNIAIFIRYSGSNINNNDFIYNNIDVYNINNYNLRNEIHYNNFYNSNINIYPSGLINNITYNNFYLCLNYFINILRDNPPYYTVYADINATNNYWSVFNINQYLADSEDDPRCPYHIIYLPKLENPEMEAGIQKKSFNFNK